MDEISSPCVRNCCLDKQDICLGCGRSVAEIVRWSDADTREKMLILKRAKQRQNKTACDVSDK